MDLKKQKALYLAAKDAYYNGARSIMTDAEFDQLEDRIRARDPKWGELAKTGVRSKKKEVMLAYPMPSLNKAYPEVIDKWLAKYQGQPYIVMDKLDGSALQVTYEKGKPVRLVTRGDGTLGKDISFHIPNLKLPNSNMSGVFRCEAVIKREVFDKKWSSEFDDPRSMVNGLLNRDGTNPHPALRDIDIVVLGKFGEAVWSTVKCQVGLPCVRTTAVAHPNASWLAELLESRINSSVYDIDGLVITQLNFVLQPTNSDKPKGIIAFKVNADKNAVEAVVEKIIWQISGRGRIIPKIHIKPTKLGGVTVRNATAHNASWMLDRGIGPGAVVKLVRSGGVIPKIVSVKKAGKKQLPSVPFKTEGVHFVVSTEGSHAEIEVKRIVRFMKTLGVELLADKTVSQLMPYLDSPEAYVKAWKDKTAKRLMLKGGLGDKTVSNIQAELDRVFSQTLNLRTLLAASQLFDAGIGDRKLKMIEAHGISMQSLCHPEFDTEKLLAVRGFSGKTKSLVSRGLPKVRRFLALVGKFLSYDGTLAKPRKQRGLLSGEYVSFTSYRDRDHEAAVLAAGAEVVNFGAKTTILLYKEGGKASSKVTTAINKGIRVCTFSQLFE